MLAGRYALEPRGLVNLRGIGKVRTWFLTGSKAGALPPCSAEDHPALRRAAAQGE
jgi:hypothetical protein